MATGDNEAGGTSLPGGVEIQVPDLTVARPVGTIVRLTTDGRLYASTNATVATYVAIAPTVAVVADPGTAAAIPVDQSASISLTIGTGAETNTLAIPTFVGQTLTIIAGVVGMGGSRAITVASAINQAGNTIGTFAAADDFFKLEAIQDQAVLRWQVIGNDGVALS